MKNLFITFSDKNYTQLTDVLIDSINTFSTHPILWYTVSKIKETNNDTERFVEMCRQKILHCVYSIENNPDVDNFVWIDGDTIVNKNIDKIWFESKRVENYPLLGKYRYKNFKFFDADIFPDVKLASKLNVEIDSYIYRQANFMLFNKSCLPFFKEVLSIMDSDIDYSLMPMGDESVINVLFCKYNYTNNLGHINLCSQSFDLTNFTKMKNREDYIKEFDVWENNYENILIFHGSKDVNCVKNILNELKTVWK